MQTGEDNLPGLVTTKHGATYTVRDKNNQLHLCSARKKLSLIVCGDTVLWKPLSKHRGVIVSVSDRKNLLSRPSPHGHPKTIAANIDQMVIVTAPLLDKARLIESKDKNPSPTSTAGDLIDLYLIDRYIVAAELINTEPLILINKSDLLSHDEILSIQQLSQHYKDLNYKLLFTSTQTENGIELLKSYLDEKTSIFAGQSGVGKSSLINVILPTSEIRTNHLSAATGRGQHTTSTTHIYDIPEGGKIIDSPGVREFSPLITNTGDMAQGFVELRKYIGQCKFRDCKHMDEPSCAIQAAYAKKDIAPSRIDNYKKMFKEMERG